MHRSWAPNLNCDPRPPATCHQRFTVTWLEEIQWNLQISDPSWKNCFPLAMPGILHEVQHTGLCFPVKTREFKTYSPKRGGGAHPMPVSPRGVMPWGYGHKIRAKARGMRAQALARNSKCGLKDIWFWMFWDLKHHLMPQCHWNWNCQTVCDLIFRSIFHSIEEPRGTLNCARSGSQGMGLTWPRWHLVMSCMWHVVLSNPMCSRTVLFLCLIDVKWREHLQTIKNLGPTFEHCDGFGNSWWLPFGSPAAFACPNDLVAAPCAAQQTVFGPKVGLTSLWLPGNQT